MQGAACAVSRFQGVTDKVLVLNLKWHLGVRRRAGSIPEDDTGTGDYALQAKVEPTLWALKMVNDQKPQCVS